MNKDKRLEIRIPESELKASQGTAKALNMHHSEFVREAIKFSISSIKYGIKNAVDNELINPHKE